MVPGRLRLRLNLLLLMPTSSGRRVVGQGQSYFRIHHLSVAALPVLVSYSGRHPVQYQNVACEGGVKIAQTLGCCSDPLPWAPPNNAVMAIAFPTVCANTWLPPRQRDKNNNLGSKTHTQPDPREPPEFRTCPESPSQQQATPAPQQMPADDRDYDRDQSPLGPGLGGIMHPRLDDADAGMSPLAPALVPRRPPTDSPRPSGPKDGGAAWREPKRLCAACWVRAVP